MPTKKDEPTKDELMEEAKEADIEGRSSMTKEELSEALDEQSGPAAPIVGNTPEGATPRSTQPEVEEAPKTDIEKLAEKHAEEKTVGTVTRDGYTPAAPHPSDREPNPLARRTEHTK